MESINDNKKALAIIVIISTIIAAIVWGIAVYVHNEAAVQVITKEAEIVRFA